MTLESKIRSYFSSPRSTGSNFSNSDYVTKSLTEMEPDDKLIVVGHAIDKVEPTSEQLKDLDWVAKNYKFSPIKTGDKYNVAKNETQAILVGKAIEGDKDPSCVIKMIDPKDLDNKDTKCPIAKNVQASK